MEVETRYADSDGVSIAYQVHGNGPVDLVLVPGFVSQVELLWEEPGVARFLRRLTSFSRLLVFDKRGQGLSDRPGRPPTLEESMDDLKAVVDAAGFERPALLGISEGGPMSTLYAATHPERLSGLILFGTFARMLEAPDFPAGTTEEALNRWGEVVQRDWGKAVALNVWAPSRVGDREFERWWARLLRQGTSPAGAIALMDLYREMDVRSILPAIDVPTLVMHRAGDRMVSAAQGRYLAETIPGARYVELAGEDHLPFAGELDPILEEVEEFLLGSRGAAESERALATILFTDIVGSTEKAAELGDRGWRALLERHDAAVRHQLSLHRGREVKTMGDGFLATFDGPARAIRCARAVQDEVAGLGIEVRAGIHTGEVELIGDDVGGMAVNIGARIGAIADPGEVLVSSTVRELVVGSGLEFVDRGTQTLKGAPGEWRLFAIDSPPT
ncbi:MAG TPA: adenylate/guanylate cyclase domain-containing protein [Solirubrobacterales bacterium]|jgi:pimeloyl-ACP methyl ester carboxylesterase|nr:adenylate/guanylate cyclase domain-containing protein [Solirubrobacterales bacterium]